MEMEIGFTLLIPKGCVTDAGRILETTAGSHLLFTFKSESSQEVQKLTKTT